MISHVLILHVLLIYGLQEYTGQTYNELLQSEGYSEIGFTDTSDVDVELAAGLGIVNGIGNNQFNPNGGIRDKKPQHAVSVVSI